MEQILIREKYFSFVYILIIILAFIGNGLAFLIFRTNTEMRKSSTITFLSFVAILDILSLFDWNLSNFLFPYFSIKLEDLNIVSCKIFSFIQFFSSESSAIILSFSTIDRYVTISKIPGSLSSRLPFSTLRTARYWSLLILITIGLLNSHFLVLNEFVKDSGSFNSKMNSSIFKCDLYLGDYRILDLWEKVHLILYSILPSFLMLLFTTLLINKIHSMNKTRNVINKYSNVFYLKKISRMNRMSITLITMTILFVSMTFPDSLVYTFYYKDIFSKSILYSWRHLWEIIFYLNHSILFITCFITNKNFRKAFLLFFGNLFRK